MGDELKFWEVSYRGLWLGGIAIVVAEGKDDAISKVKSHKATTNFKEVNTVQIYPVDGVLHNNNGDY